MKSWVTQQSHKTVTRRLYTCMYCHESHDHHTIVPQPHVIVETGNHSMIVIWLSHVTLSFCPQLLSMFWSMLRRDIAMWTSLKKIVVQMTRFLIFTVWLYSWLITSSMSVHNNVNQNVWGSMNIDHYWVYCHVAKKDISIIVMLKIGILFVYMYVCM